MKQAKHIIVEAATASMLAQALALPASAQTGTAVPRESSG
jgi:hypothetical protein